MATAVLDERFSSNISCTLISYSEICRIVMLHLYFKKSDINLIYFSNIKWQLMHLSITLLHYIKSIILKKLKKIRKLLKSNRNFNTFALNACLYVYNFLLIICNGL